MKILGILTLLTSALFLFYEMAKCEKKKIREGEALLLLLRHIKNEIVQNKTPLSHALDYFENKELKDNGFLDSIKSRGIVSALYDSKSLLVSKEEKEILSSFALELQSPKKDTKRVVELYIQRFEKEHGDTVKEHQKKLKTLGGVTATFTLMLICVLI